MDLIQEDMRPGVITRDGFLGSDRRKLADILEEDHAVVRRLGLTHERIADRMQELREAGKRGLGQAIRVAPHFDVRVDSVRGKLPCPFRHPGVFPKTLVMVTNLDTGEEITYSDLNIHMIRSHGFYEGKGAGFRLDPAVLARVLEIVPEA
jgi:hypothetical protein